MVERMNSFPTSEIQIGHILTTGVILALWEDKDDDGNEIVIAMTAAGIGHAWEKGSMVGNVVGLVSAELAESLRAEFAQEFVETYGDPTDLRD